MTLRVLEFDIVFVTGDEMIKKEWRDELPD